MKRYLILLLFVGAGAPLFGQTLPSDAPAATPPVRLEQPATAPTAVGTTSDAAAPEAAPAAAVETSAATAPSATTNAAATPTTEVWVDDAAATSTVVPDERAKDAVEQQKGDAPADAR